MYFLKQNTAATIKAGPFLDDTDGKTAETGLTISQADIRLSKNGGDFAQTNNATGATHDENGYYNVPLDATDTNTLERLKVAIQESGALPVWHEFTVLLANVYDAMIAGSDKLQVDAVEISGDSAAADNLESDYDGTGLNRSNSTIGTATNITNDVGISQAGADKVWSSAARTLTSLGASLVAEIFNALISSMTTVGSIGKKLADWIIGDVLKISGSTEAADKLEASVKTIVNGAAVSGTLSPTEMTTNLTETRNDQYNGRRLIWTSGILKDLGTAITDYEGSTKKLTYVAVNGSPSVGDTFNIV